MRTERPSKSSPLTAELLRPGRKRTLPAGLQRGGHEDDLIKAKEELEALNATLEQRVAERTAELLEAQEALRQSQKLEAMGQLTGGIAHDFNNLLTPILANLDLLRQSVKGARNQRLIDGALVSAASAQALVQRLLAFARRQSLQPVRVDVAALVEAMTELFARTLGPRIQVERELAVDLQAVRADRNQLEMALLNLAVNARDAMPDGGRLIVRAANERIGPRHETGLTPGAYVRLSIIDHGIGMDEATLRRAVEPFFSTKEAGEGTGLGLSMVDGLASQMGGAFRLWSHPGVGTAATLWLPKWHGSVEVEEARPPAATASGRSGTAMVVDDHDLVRASTADMLESIGYDVVEAESGESAAEMIAAGQRIDLLVTDHLMPGMSGAELARLARAHRPGLPVLLVSGASSPEGLPPDLPCLTKPFRKGDLEARLSEILERAGADA